MAERRGVKIQAKARNGAKYEVCEIELLKTGSPFEGAGEVVTEDRVEVTDVLTGKLYEARQCTGDESGDWYVHGTGIVLRRAKWSNPFS